MNLSELLPRLAGAIDPAHCAEARRLQQEAWSFRPVPRIPVLVTGARPPHWASFPYRETVDNPEKMLLNELREVYAGALLKDDRVLAVRANFGPGVIASLFGAEWVQIDDQLPAVKPLNGREAIRRVVRAGLPALDTGHAARVLTFQRCFLAALSVVRGSVRVFLSDTQGPLSSALQLWGADLYAALVEEPALVHALLDLLTQATIGFTRLQKRNVGEPETSADHFFYAVPGGIRIVDDVAMNLSPAMYLEFCVPYHERLYQAFGGGYMHYCGHKLQSHALRLGTEGLRGIEMGFDNPERSAAYRLETLWREAQPHGRALLWMRDCLPEARPDISTGLLFGYRSPGVDWAEAVRRLEHARRFWTNEVAA